MNIHKIVENVHSLLKKRNEVIPCPLPHFMGSLRKSKEMVSKSSISSFDRGKMRVL